MARGITVKVSTGELDRVAEDLGRLGRVKLKPAMTKAMRYMRKTVIARIQRRGVDAEGNPFKPLSSKYRRRKDRTYGAQPILVRTGRMVRSLSGGRDAVAKASNRGFRYGTTLDYAAFALAERDAISTSDEDLLQIEEFVLDEILRAFD